MTNLKQDLIDRKCAHAMDDRSSASRDGIFKFGKGGLSVAIGLANSFMHKDLLHTL